MSTHEPALTGASLPETKTLPGVAPGGDSAAPARPAARWWRSRRWRLVPSIRLRLALWNVAILLSALLLFGISLYAFLAWRLDKDIDESLAQQYSQIRDSTNFDFSRDPTSGEPVLVTNLRPDAFGSDELDVYVQIARLNGSIPPWGRSSNLGNRFLPLATDVLTAVKGDQTVPEREVIVDGNRLRLFSGPLYVRSERGSTIIGVIQVARSLERTEATLTLLRVLLIGGGLMTLLIAGVASYALSGAALAPLDRLTQAARDIGAARDFSRRVKHTGPDDEVAQLAGTFNEMLVQLQAAHNSLAAALDTQRRFVADASHELRTPLTTIRGNVGLLRRAIDLDPNDRDAALADIDSEAQRMGRLVNQMLSLARADASLTLNQQSTDLDPIVHDVGRQLLLLANARGLTATTEPVEPLRVIGNPDALKQLLLILVDNAVKYTPAPGSVRLSTRRSGDEAEILVSDTGIGIAEQDLAHIFDRFYRADTARSGGGAGLGLAIARWLVDAHGGRLLVESRPGAGSTFRVLLPLTP
jgi:signal transduction histidine kinase